MAVDTLAPKNYKKAPLRLEWDKAERDFAEQYRDEMKAHCEKFNRPQDRELLCAIEANLLDPRWGELLPASVARHPLDICDCGDYRRDHESDGELDGPCKLNGLGHHVIPDVKCLMFALDRRHNENES